jgi:hypothetical protein
MRMRILPGAVVRMFAGIGIGIGFVAGAIGIGIGHDSREMDSLVFLWSMYSILILVIWLYNLGQPQSIERLIYSRSPSARIDLIVIDVIIIDLIIIDLILI